MKNQFNEMIFNEVLTYDGVDTDTSRETQYPFPCCNHVSGITKYNAGYTRGFLDDTVPFEAEVFANEDNEIWLAVVLPVIFGETVDSIEFENGDTLSWDYSVLAKNMKYLGSCDAFILDYNDLFMENEIFTMSNGRVPGYAKYFLDSENNLMVQVFVGLMDEESVLNYSDIDIVDF